METTVGNVERPALVNLPVSVQKCYKLSLDGTPLDYALSPSSAACLRSSSFCSNKSQSSLIFSISAGTRA